MHPILSSRRNLGLYLLGWLPIGLLLTAGLGERATWLSAGAVFLPLSFIFAFISLNAGYICRVFPIDARASVWRTALVHVVAAAMASAYGGDWRAWAGRARSVAGGCAPVVWPASGRCCS
jgi:hypothetical protein